MARIDFDRVSKRFGGKTVVEELTLTVNDQELLTLVGPSGCGKSTTLNMLAGLEDPSSGLISIDGKVVNAVSPGARDIAMVFQSYALYPHMTVRDNIGFGLTVRGLNKAEIAKRVGEAAKILDIEEFLDRRPGQLSGGQRQRVALGRALTRDPKAFLLDEPLSNLDAQLRTVMRAELRILFQRIKGTVVYVTHDQAEAMTLSDRLVVMNLGVVQQVGTPLEVYNHPVNIFVARFLGSPSMNFVRGAVTRGEGAARFQAPGVTTALPGAIGAALAGSAGDAFVLGVRPEDVRVGPGVTAEEARGRVMVVESMGSVNLVYLQVEEQRIVASTEPTFTPALGESLPISFVPDRIHLFDAATERSLTA